MKLTTAAIWSNYRTSIVDDTGIEPRDGYTAPPHRRRLVLRFEAIHPDDGDGDDDAAGAAAVPADVAIDT